LIIGIWQTCCVHASPGLQGNTKQDFVNHLTSSFSSTKCGPAQWPGR
jgi:hypothetical protein